MANPEWTDEQRSLIRNTIAKGATDDELELFLYWCKVSGFDPLKKEAHFTIRKNKCPNCNADVRLKCDQCVKGYIRMPVFIPGINGILSRASRNPNYRGIVGWAVRENDTFTFDAKNQEPVEHLFFAKDRGKLAGAWATVKFRDDRQPFSIWYAATEYASSAGVVAKDMPELMLVTATYSIALRRAFPEDVGPAYAAEEFGGYIEEKTGTLVLGKPHPEPEAKTTEDIIAEVEQNHPEVQTEVQQVPPRQDYTEEVTGATETTSSTVQAGSEPTYFTEGVLEYRDNAGVKEVKVHGAWKVCSGTVGGIKKEHRDKLYLLFGKTVTAGIAHFSNYARKYFTKTTIAALTWEELAVIFADMEDGRPDPRFKREEKTGKPVEIAGPNWEAFKVQHPDIPEEALFNLRILVDDGTVVFDSEQFKNMVAEVEPL